MRFTRGNHRQAQMSNPIRRGKGAYQPLKETKKQKDSCVQKQCHQKCKTKLPCQLGLNTTDTEQMSKIQMETNPPTVASHESATCQQVVNQFDSGDRELGSKECSHSSRHPSKRTVTRPAQPLWGQPWNGSRSASSAAAIGSTTHCFDTKCTSKSLERPSTTIPHLATNG